MGNEDNTMLTKAVFDASEWGSGVAAYNSSIEQMNKTVAGSAVFQSAQWQALANRFKDLDKQFADTRAALASKGAGGGGGGGGSIADAAATAGDTMGQMAAAAGMLGGVVAGVTVSALTFLWDSIQKVVGSLTDFKNKIEEIGQKSLDTAARFEEIRMVAQFMGQQAGYTAEEIDALSEKLIENGARTDVANLLLAQFARYNLDATKAVDLLAIAQGSAIIAGQGTSQALEGMLHGIVTYNQRVLRTYGIVVDMTDAQDKYAQELGKTAEELTNEEKIQAALNAVLEEGQEIAGLYAEAMKLPGKQLRSLSDRVIPELYASLGAPFQMAFAGAVDVVMHFAKTVLAAVQEGGMLFDILARMGAVASIAADRLGYLANVAIDAAEAFGMNIKGGIEGVIDSAFDWGINISAQLAQGIIDGAATAIITAMDYITSLLTSWLAPGSPPRVAPEIDKWGLATAGEWLHGFTQADFGALKAIKSPLEKALASTLGEDSKKEVAQLMTQLTGGLFGAIEGGVMPDELFNQIAGATARFGDEIALLARDNVELAYAEEKAAQAQKELTDAQNEAANANAKVNKYVREYNDMLRSGATETELAAKMEQIRAEEERRSQAEAQAAVAQDDLDSAVTKRDVLKDQVDLQAELVNTLLDIADTSDEIMKSEADKDKTGGKGGGKVTGGGGGGTPFDFSAIATKMGLAVEEMKKKLEEKIKGAFGPVQAEWDNFVKDFNTRLGPWQRIWETISNDPFGALQKISDRFATGEGYIDIALLLGDPVQQFGVWVGKAVVWIFTDMPTILTRALAGGLGLTFGKLAAIESLNAAIVFLGMKFVEGFMEGIYQGIAEGEGDAKFMLPIVSAMTRDWTDFIIKFQLMTGVWFTLLSLLFTKGWNMLLTTFNDFAFIIGFAVDLWKLGIEMKVKGMMGELEAVWDEKWTNIQKGYDHIKDKIIDAVSLVMYKLGDLKGALESLYNWVSEHVFNFQINLPDLPAWAIPGSPTPFEIGLKGIGRALTDVNRIMATGPALQPTTPETVLQAAGRQATWTPQSAMPIGPSGGTNVVVNLNGVTITSGMDQAQFVSMLTGAIRKAVA